MSVIAIHRGESLPAPASQFDDTGRLFLYVSELGGSIPFNVDIITTFGSDPTGAHWSAKPLQTFLGAPTFITGTLGSGTGYVNVAANTGGGQRDGYIDLQVGETYNPFASIGPYYVHVIQFGAGSNYWVPPDGFNPVPTGWTPGDPPPSPWSDGDPVPPGWIPPDGYVPAPTCTFAITPEAVVVPYTQGTTVVDINASSPDCAWTTLPNDSWLFGTYSGTGTQTREISWTANETGATRIGTVTMAGLTFTVIQLPPPPPDNIAIETGCHGASVTLLWGAMPDAVGYNIYRDGVLLASVSALAQEYTDTAVAIGTRYAYQVETRYPASVVGTRSDKYYKTPCTTCPVDDLSDWQSLCAVDTKYSPVVSTWQETCGSEQKWTQVSTPAPVFLEKVVSP